jgi:hypothetical protein
VVLAGAGLVLPLVADRAELLTATALAVGHDRAVRVTRTALGEHEFVAILPVLQSAGTSPELRSAVHQEKLSLKDLRQAAADAAGVDLPAMAQLHRVSLGKLLVTSVSVLAVSFVISALADIGLDTIIDVLADASWAFVWRLGWCWWAGGRRRLLVRGPGWVGRWLRAGRGCRRSRWCGAGR